MNVLKGQLAIVLACLWLTACGGGGDNTTSDTAGTQQSATTSSTISSGQTSPDSSASEEVIAVQGMGVKGPLANAIVSVYAIDNSKANLKGQLLAEGVTDENATLLLDVPARHAIEEMLLIEYTGGQELDSSTPVLPTLRTVITAQQFLNQTPVYATPLTTLVIDHAARNTGTGAATSTLASKLDEAGTATKKAFGLGLLDNIDLFTGAPVLSSNTSQQDSLAYRTAIEVFAAVMDKVKTESEARGNTINADDIIPAVATDMQDGNLDGQNAGTPVATLSALSAVELQGILTTDPATLTIPGTQTPLTELDTVLADEATTIEANVEPATLTTPTFTAIAPDFTATTTTTTTTTTATEPATTSTTTAASTTTTITTATTPTSEPTLAPAPVAPSVAFSTPADNSSIQAGGNLWVEVTASDSDGSVASCSLSLNGTTLRAEVSAPYQWGSDTINADAPLLNMASGTYTLQATCVDNDNLSSSAKITVTVAEPPATAPEPTPVTSTVSITWTAPTTRADGSALSPAEIDHYEVYYYLEGSSLGTGDIASFTPDQGTSSNPAILQLTVTGNYVFAVSCVDSNGSASDISKEVTITIP